jgi:septum formation protein
MQTDANLLLKMLRIFSGTYSHIQAIICCPMQTGYFTIKVVSQSHIKELILASTSIYRKDLLQRFGLPFNCIAPSIDETVLPGESTRCAVQRLAQAKADHASKEYTDAVVIGSDQLAEYQGQALGKPGTAENAISQLQQFSGQKVLFHTATCVVCRVDGLRLIDINTTEIHFRPLTYGEICRYVELEQPLDCAGGFKSEKAGPMLMLSNCSTDPTAIIGLPLIALSAMLRKAGFELP